MNHHSLTSGEGETLGQAGPRFCPRCDVVVAHDSALCDHCGERVLDQGYCAICERFWRLPLGSDCPKHDVELIESPALGRIGDDADPLTHWVTVETFGDALKAEAPRIRLEAEGIPTFVEGSRMGSQSMYHVATGGVKLQVPQALVNEARILLAQTWSVAAPPEDFDDAWDELGPEPGARRRSIMKGVIVVILIGPLVMTVLTKLLGL